MVVELDGKVLIFLLLLKILNILNKEMNQICLYSRKFKPRSVDRVTKITQPFGHVNLLRLDDEEGSHSRLFGGQTNKQQIYFFHSCQKRLRKTFVT